MTLSFSTHWPKAMPEHMAGKPNYFVDKVWKGILHPEVHPRSEMYSYQKEYSKKFSGDWGILPKAYPKIHTMREDPKKRWKAGNKIHPVINNRTKFRFQFAPVIPCVSTQKVVIKHNDPIQRGVRLNKTHIWIDGGHSECIWKDGEIVNCASTIEQLAINDGFDSVEDFFSWFNKDFTGKIIHWTNHRY